MKKIHFIWVVILIFCISPITAFAQDADQSTPTKDAATATNLISFTIDDKNVYDGMDKAYQNGYAPQVKNGTATIVIPLITNGEIKDNKIIATLELGDPTSSPFVFKNYQKTVSLSQNIVNDGNTAAASYLVCFDLSLDPNRTNGNYPVTVNIQAQGADGSLIQQSFVSYVTITDGKDPNAPAAAEPPLAVETPTSQPKVIVSGYNVDPSPIIAGNDFTVRVTLKNTSNMKSVQNMTVTITSESPHLSLQNDSDTIYINSIGAGETAEITLTYKTDLEISAGRYNIALAISYDNSNAESLSSSGTVSVLVNQSLRVDMETPQIASEVNTGDTFPVSLQVMNLGRSMVYNVRVELSAPGLIPSGVAFIGNMEAGSKMPCETNVFVGTKNMSEGNQSGERYGLTNGILKLIYEDAAGQEYTKEVVFSTTINEPVIRQNTNEPEDDPKKAGQWWISILIFVAIAAGLAGFLIVRKKKQVNQNEDI